MKLETTTKPDAADLPNIGFVEMSPQLLIQILQGLEFDGPPRLFEVIDDPVPADAVYDHCEYSGASRDSLFIYYRTGTDGGEVTPTIMSKRL